MVSYDEEGNERRRRGRRFGNEQSEEEMNIYDGMHAEYDDLTSGYSTISSNKCDISQKRSQLQIPAQAFPSGAMA